MLNQKSMRERKRKLSKLARSIAESVCLVNRPAASKPCKTLCEKCCLMASCSLLALSDGIPKGKTLWEICEETPEGGFTNLFDLGKLNQELDTQDLIKNLASQLRNYGVGHLPNRPEK